MTRTYPNAVAFRQAIEARLLRTVAQQRGEQIQGPVLVTYWNGLGVGRAT